MIKSIIIEDQPPAQRILQNYIEKHGGIELVEIFCDALTAIEFLKNNSVDLIFLDIHLPKISGIDFMKILNPRPKIILTTAFQDYALQSYEYDVLDYLLKPFSFERFIKAVSKYKAETISHSRQINRNENTASDKDFTFIKAGYDYLKIEYENIYFIKADGDYTVLHTKDAKHTVSISLKQWNDSLPQNIFFQIHRSIIININYIEKVSGNEVIICGKKLLIGRSYRTQFFEKFL